MCIRDSDWPAQPLVGIYFNYGLVDEFMREWLLRQQELHAGEITREEYFEWKINWPLTCDAVSYTHLALRGGVGALPPPSADGSPSRAAL